MWQSDAIHRARNLAQLAASLAAVAGHPSRRWLEPEFIEQIRDLSQLYETICDEPNSAVSVPCAEVLEQIVTRLTLIFGTAREIASDSSIAPIELPPDQRRALVLLGSELVVNALKHRFFAGCRGTIHIILRQTRKGIELIVEDDGSSEIDSYTAGNGRRLLDRLSSILSADVRRMTGKNGQGFRISVLVAKNHLMTERAEETAIERQDLRIRDLCA